MATAFNIPNEIELKSYLMMLFDGAGIGPGQAIDGNTSGAIMGAFIDDNDVPVATCVCDIEFAAFAGCSMTMLPPGAAEDAVKDKKLEPMMLDNFQEVMNIFSRLFMNDKTPHLRLDKCYAVDDAPEAFAAIANSTENRSNMEIDIPRYGKGNVSFVAI